MQGSKRGLATDESRSPRTLRETNYLSDVARLRALRFKRPGDDVFQAQAGAGVPASFISPLRLSADRIEQGKEASDDLHIFCAPGSLLSSARPKASVLDDGGALAFAKFPKESDDDSIKTWEKVAPDHGDLRCGLTLA